MTDSRSTKKENNLKLVYFLFESYDEKSHPIKISLV